MKHGLIFIYVGIATLACLQLACSSNNGNQAKTKPSEDKLAAKATPASPVAAPAEGTTPQPKAATTEPAKPAAAKVDDGTFDPDLDSPPPQELASRQDCIKRQANVFKLTEASTWGKLKAAQRQAKLDEWARDNAESLAACQTGDKVIVTCQGEAKNLEEYEICRGG